MAASALTPHRSTQAAGHWSVDFTVPDLLRHQAERRGEALALSAAAQGGRRERLTYAQLHGRMGSSAATLAAAGLRRGDRLAIYLDNDRALECYLAALGALALGAVAVPLNTRSADEELRHAISLTEPRFVVCDEEGRQRLAAALASSAPAFVSSQALAEAQAGAGDFRPAPVSPARRCGSGSRAPSRGCPA